MPQKKRRTFYRPHQRTPYNDGVLYFGEMVPRLAEGTRKKIGESIVIKGKYYYQIESLRQRDYELADALGRKLNYKVSIPIHQNITQQHKVIIYESQTPITYDIITIDTAARRYLYLERVETNADISE